MSRHPSSVRAPVEALEPRRLLATVPSGFSDAVFANGFSAATSMAFGPGGRLYVTQQTGAVRVVKNGKHLNPPFVTLTTDGTGERGVLGLAFDPQFSTNRFVYVYYTVPGTPAHNRVSRFTAALNADGSIGDTAVPGSERIIVELDNLPTTATNHNGGAIHFGTDGKLYIGVGDAANSANSQTLNNRHGKVLRINKDGTIPSDNPFYNTATGANRAIWVMGLRNPFTFSFQPASSRVFINDVGSSKFEEINNGLPGRNYGWPQTEGFFDPAQFPNFTNPIHAYPPGTASGQGRTVIGGPFYNPAVQQFPTSFNGKYFYADFIGGWIRTLDPTAGNTTAHVASNVVNPVDMDVGPDGALYYLERGAGRVGRISFNPSSATVDFEPAAVGQIASGVYSEDAHRFSNLPGGGGSTLEPLVVHASAQGYSSKVLSTTNWGRRIGVARENGAAFSLATFDYAAGRWGEAGDFVLTGRFNDGSTQTRNVSFSSKQLARMTLNWTNLVSLDVNFAGGINAAYGALDNFVFSSGGGGGSEVSVDIEAASIGPIPSGVYQEDGFGFTNLPGRGGTALEAIQVFGPPQGYSSKVLSPTNWGRKIEVARSGGAAFSLKRFSYAAGRWGEAGDFVLTGTFTNGSTQTRNVSFSSKQLSTLNLDWTNLRAISINFAGGTNDAYGALDNFIFEV